MLIFVLNYKDMSKTNTLTSHHGESNTSRSDKMSGWIKTWKSKNNKKGTSMKIAKIISNRKRRMFLKNQINWDKI